LNGWQHYYRNPPDTNANPAATNIFPVAPQSVSPAADVLFALNKYDSAIEELRQASRLPYSRFPLNYDDDNPERIFPIFPHSALMPCAQVLQLRAIAELELGQTGKALDDVKLTLRLTDSIRTEPFRDSHLARIDVVNFTLQPVWEGLAKHQWTDEQLVMHDHELARLDFLSDFDVVVRGTRAIAIKQIDYLRNSHFGQVVISEWGYPDDGENIGDVILHLFPTGWFYQNQILTCRVFTQADLPLVDAKNRIASPAFIRRPVPAIGSNFGSSNPYNVIAGWLVPWWIGDDVGKFANAQSSVDLARVAIALERYRFAHGEFPETLDVLSPQFVDKLPHDIINGQPLYYHRTDDGQFVLYSVGWNEKDDGGVVGLSDYGKTLNINIGDWVWRYK
jgi:tetratricopeptide (TPR) repeat protein